MSGHDSRTFRDNARLHIACVATFSPKRANLGAAARGSERTGAWGAGREGRGPGTLRVRVRVWAGVWVWAGEGVWPGRRREGAGVGDAPMDVKPVMVLVGVG